MKKITGINGFGRFGLHLIKYWLDRSSEANFKIDFINDDYLTIDDAYKMIIQDKAVVFNKYKVKKIGSIIRFISADGKSHEVEYTNFSKDDIPWVGKPDYFLECSGKNTVKEDCQGFLTGNTKTVAISATSWDCDKVLVYGFNHKDYQAKDDKVISYGSCTVNAYLPIAQYMHNKYGILETKQFYNKDNLKEVKFSKKETENHLTKKSFVEKFMGSVKQKMYGRQGK